MISLVILSDANGAPGQLAGWGRNGVPGQLAGWGRKNPRICFSASVAADPLSLPSTPPQAAEIPAGHRFPPYLACPRCHLKAIHRSRRRGLDWIMSAIGFCPARCFTCDKRFYTRQFLTKT
jgi:hypothetical protein